MGTNNTQERPHKREKDQKFKYEDFSLHLNEFSSYNGVQSESQSDATNISRMKVEEDPNQRNQQDNSSFLNSSTSNEEEDNTTKTNTTEQEKFPVKLIWKNRDGEENDVKIRAEFLKNWCYEIKLKRNPTSGFLEFTTMLPRGKHQFKFIVDGNWVCSDDYKKINNGDTINNYIEINETKENGEEVNKKKHKTPKASEPKRKKYNPQNEVIDIKEMSKIYGNYYPLRTQLNEDLPKIPFHYKKPFNIDYFTNQQNIGNQTYQNYKEKNVLNENHSYKKILKLPVINLNHLCINNNVTNSNNKFVSAVISEHKQQKVLTFLYYKNRESHSQNSSFSLENNDCLDDFRMKID